MKLFTGSLAAGLVLLAGGAQAQVPGPLHGGIGFRGPLCDGTAPGSGRRRAALRARAALRIRPGSLLPSTEVYSVLRDNGFSPLGIPRLRGFVYTIAVIDRGGEDGRLVIDARNGRIIRFLPAYRMGDNYYEDAERAPRALRARRRRPQAGQAPDQVQAAPRPSRPAQVASRAVPMPKAKPIAAKPAPAPVQQAAAPAPKSAEVQAAVRGPGDNRLGSSQARPADCPTQDMPTAQGLE